MISNKLLELCHKFIDDNNITCAETIYQQDRIITNAYELIEHICDLIGYKQSEE